jgi:peptidoglycan/LPS O-acetylase OafA/YrhL
MKLRRITTHGNWIPEVDGLRFVAILATLLIHIFGWTLRSPCPFAPLSDATLGRLVETGGRGVLMFFSISGFILAQPFVRQHLLHGNPVSLRAFFMRRLTRLEPPYILSLLIYTVSIAIYQHHVRPLLIPLLAHIFYVHNYFSLQTLNLVTWSLEVEVQFYLLAPLLGYLYAISSPVLRRGIMISLILASAVLKYNVHGMLSQNLPGQLQFFLVGFLLADIRATRTHSQRSRWWDAASPFVWVSIFAVPTRQNYLLPLLILLAFLATFNGPITRRIFATQWIALTGGMCYSFYLMHMLVVSTMFKITRRFIIPSSLLLSYLIQIVLLGTTLYFICTAYYVLIERPCMDPKWPRKLLARISNYLHPRQAAAAAELDLENS